MSEESAADRLDESARQYGEELIEQGEPFDRDTLDAIRNLVAQSDDVSDVSSEQLHEGTMPLFEGAMSTLIGRRKRSNPLESQPQETQANIGLDTHIHSAPVQEGVEAGAVKELGSRGSWRKLTLVEGAVARAVRRALFTPRGASILLLAGVTIWRPWFIPSLVLVVVLTLFFLPLLVGVFIGQDRMGRFLLKLTKKYVWADSGRGRALQKVLPRRLHPFLYRPMGDDDTWDGLIDPSFEARLARLRG